MAYVRQAVWNAARLTERQRQRYEKRIEPLDLDREVPSGGFSPESRAALAEEIENLPDLQPTILDRLVNSDATVESLASELGVSEESIVQIINEAADALIPSSRPKRPRKKGRGKVIEMPWKPEDEFYEEEVYGRDPPDEGPALRDDEDFQLIQRFCRSPGYYDDTARELADEWGCSIDEVLAVWHAAIDRLVPKLGGLAGSLN